MPLQQPCPADPGITPSTAAPVHVAIVADLLHLNALAASGARIVELFMVDQHPLLACLAVLPADLAALTQLRTLYIANSSITGGWTHLPQQLLQLTLSRCRLQ